MRRTFALLFTTALVGALAAVVAAPAGAQEDPVAQVGILCLSGTEDEGNLMYVVLETTEDIDILDAEAETDSELEDLVFYLADDFGDPLADPLGVLEAGDLAVAELPQAVLDDGPPWAVWVEYENLDTEELEEVFTVFYIDPCGTTIEIMGECTETGLEATIEVTFDNDSFVTLEFLEGWAFVPPELEGIELTLEPTTILDGESAVSSPFTIPGDAVGQLDVELYFNAEGAIEEDETLFDIEFISIASWEVEGCTVVPIPVVPEPEAAPAAAVATEPAFTG